MTASSNIQMSAFQIAGRVALPPDRFPTSSERLLNSGGQYTNTREAAQEKRFELQLPAVARTEVSLATGAAVDELVEQQFR
jgi:hypothetical protein